MKNKLTKELFENVKSVTIQQIFMDSPQYWIQNISDSNPNFTFRGYSNFVLSSLYEYETNEIKTVKGILYSLDFEKLAMYIAKNPDIDFVKIKNTTKPWEIQ